jgi:hypothetical protein
MNDNVRDLVSALLAIAYAAVILLVGELYIGKQVDKASNDLGATKQTHATPAARWSP